MKHLFRAVYHQAALLWYSCTVQQTAEECLRAALHRAELNNYLRGK